MCAESLWWARLSACVVSRRVRERRKLYRPKIGIHWCLNQQYIKNGTLRSRWWGQWSVWVTMLAVGETGTSDDSAPVRITSTCNVMSTFICYG